MLPIIPIHRHAGISILIALLCAGCSANENGIDFGKRSSQQSSPGGSSNASTGVIDMQATCGLPPGAMNTPGTQIFQQNMKSLPIVVQGTSMMVGYTVSTQASVNLVSLNDRTTQNISVQVLSVETSSNIFGIPKAIAQGKADDAAKAKSGSVTTNRLSNGAWLNLVSSPNPEYQGLFCAVSGNKSVTSATGGATGNVEFTPALVNNVSPLAPRATLDKELSAPRVFHVTANVTSAAEGWASGSQAGTITITPIPPTTQVNGQTFAADVAYEVKADFPSGAIKVGLSRNQKFFINTKTHTMEAVVDDSGALDPQSGAELPPTVLVRQQ